MKTILITGASSGIGHASVEACLKAGHKVIATARKDEDHKKLQDLGATPIFIEQSDEASVVAAAEIILSLQ